MAKSSPRKKRAVKKTATKTIKKAAKKMRAPQKNSSSLIGRSAQTSNAAKALRGTCSVYCRNEEKTVGKHLSEAAAETLAKTHCDGKHSVQCRQ